MKTEKRFYVVDAKFCEPKIIITNMSDENFILEAEKQGSVYSENGFLNQFNNLGFGAASAFLRIFEMPCAE